MSKRKTEPAIRLRGVRHNNLKGFDLDLPLNRLIVVTGLSGSGKSSLAFDTLYAEGQRRYIETFSPYTRQFFDRMDKPQVDSIEGIPPAIAIEQRNAVKTTRSTVGTMTEINEHMKQVWPLISTLHCRHCGRPVQRETPQRIWELVAQPAPARSSGGTRPASFPGGAEVLITFELSLSKKLPLKETLALIEKQGYQRLLIFGPAATRERGADEPPVLREITESEYQTAADDAQVGAAQGQSVQVLRLEEAPVHFGGNTPESLTVIQDRIRLTPENRARFVEACEQAYHFGKGRLTLCALVGEKHESVKWRQPFSRHFHCAGCDLEYREPTPALFSFNHPLGACPTCKGFGRVIQIDYNLAIPDHSLSLNGGAVKPWRTGTGAESQADMTKFCKKRKIPMDVPFRELPEDVKRWVIDGDPDYGIDSKHQWPHAWYGVKGYFRWLESKAYKMHVRVLLSKYRAYVLCQDCQGRRLQPDALLHRIHPVPGDPRELTLPDFYQLPVRDALQIIDQLIERFHPRPNEPLGLVLGEVRHRLFYLAEIGLGYLTLDRPTRSLSGGETERVNLTSCLGSRLVNTLYVLDEPSVGLHPRDTERLVKILEGLRDAGNTVLVVEHEEGVMRAADQIIDLGPGHGESGGELVFQGDFPAILKAKGTLTGEYLSGRKRIEIPVRRPVNGRSGPALKLRHGTRHNLNDLAVDIPLQRLVCITGVSGSGKTTLVRDVLLPALAEKLGQPEELATDRDKNPDTDSDGDENESTASGSPVDLEGTESIERMVLVDQSPIGRTPRSNPAVYIGAFDDLRELFAQTEQAKRLGFNASAFSFNSGQGQCDRCRGAGFEKIEMQFLSDVFIKCPTCNGRRYREHILEIKVSSDEGDATATKKSDIPSDARSIADVLESSVDDLINWLEGFENSRPAEKARKKLELLQEVGLGYLRLGQPINTLSGGECQRLKLVSHLAAIAPPSEPAVGRRKKPKSTDTPDRDGPSSNSKKSILFLFDEPTSGLHFEDVRVLLLALQRLVDAGHSVLVIEHHLDVIKCADWVIDLGPGAGDEGGRLVACGTPEQVADCAESHTGRALKKLLNAGRKAD